MSARKSIFQKNLYFKYDAKENKSKCIVNNCNKLLSGNLSSNLARHLKSCHTSLAKEINLIENDQSDTEAGPCNENIASKKLKLHKNDYIKAAVGLITTRGLPFSIFDYEEMRTLLKPLEGKFNTFKINKHNIIGYMKQSAEQITDRIKLEVKNKLISLKIDAASRYGRHVLGINCQYILNDNSR